MRPKTPAAVSPPRFTTSFAAQTTRSNARHGSAGSNATGNTASKASRSLSTMPNPSSCSLGFPQCQPELPAVGRALWRGSGRPRRPKDKSKLSSPRPSNSRCTCLRCLSLVPRQSMTSGEEIMAGTPRTPSRSCSSIWGNTLRVILPGIEPPS